MPLGRGIRYRVKAGVRLAFNKSGKVVETKRVGPEKRGKTALAGRARKGD